MFGCISKKFPENIFWCLENATRKRQTHLHPGQNLDRRSTGFDGAVLRELQSDDRAVDHDLAKHRAASRDRDRREGEITIDDAISRSVDRNLAKHRADRNQREGGFAIDGAGACERRRLELGRANGADWVSVSLSLSLSLSLSGIHLK